MKWEFFLSIDLDKINLDDVNFDEDDPETLIHVRPMTYRYKQYKSCKKDISKKLMPVAFHLSRGWDWCLPEDEKRDENTIFTDKN